jgi:outer membrane biosynthesis protein TonB
MIKTLFSSPLRLLILPTILLTFVAVSVGQTPAVETKTEKVAAAEKPLGEVDRWIKENDGKELLIGTCLEDCGTDDDQVRVEPGRVLVTPKPQYPTLARMAHAAGIVKVQLIIDKNGQVVAAQAIDGHPLLFGVSLAAAKATKFSPSKYDGQPVHVIGVIQYNFVAQ